MEILELPVKSIKPYKNNPRHNDKAVEFVANSLREFGWKQPIVIDDRYEIVAGHTRWKAAKMLGMETVPCVMADDLTPEQVQAYRLADNKTAEMADWDFELLEQELNDIDPAMFDMADFGFFADGEEPETQQKEIIEDEAPELDEVEPVCKRGQIWQLGDHRLMCGDSTSAEDVTRLMHGEKADMVFTDPPYGMRLDSSFGGMSYNPNAQYKVVKNYADVIGDKEDFKPELITKIFDNFDYCKEIFLWGADYFAELLPNKNKGSWLVWDKRATLQDLQWTTSEFELCWSKNKHHREILRHTWHGLVGLSAEDIKKRVHPTKKPIKMISECIDKFSKEKTLIIDLYGGSGSTLIACEQLDRRCFMMELDPHYCDVIIKRWEDFTGQKAELVEE